MKPCGCLALLVVASMLAASGCGSDTAGTVEMKGDREAINRQLITPGKSETSGSVKPRKKEESFEGKIKGRPGGKSL